MWTGHSVTASRSIRMCNNVRPGGVSGAPRGGDDDDGDDDDDDDIKATFGELGANSDCSCRYGDGKQYAQTCRAEVTCGYKCK